jgi:hypothetical protein
MSDVLGNGDQADYGPTGQGASESPDVDDTSVSAGAAEDLANGELATDDGTDRAMSDHIQQPEPMVDEGLEADASRQSVDDVDFVSDAVQDGTEGDEG